MYWNSVSDKYHVVSYERRQKYNWTYHAHFFLLHLGLPHVIFNYIFRYPTLTFVGAKSEIFGGWGPEARVRTKNDYSWVMAQAWRRT